MGHNSAHYDFFQILPITCIQFGKAVGFIFVDKCSGVRLLVAMVSARPVFKETSKLLARVITILCFQQKYVGGSFSVSFAGFDVTF